MHRQASLLAACALAALLATVLSPAASRPALAQGAPPGADLARFADLEALAQRVERDGFHRLPLERLAPTAPADLAFKPDGNGLDAEKAFRAAWAAAYAKVGDDLLSRAKALAEAESLAKPKEMDLAPEKLLPFLAGKVGKKKGAAAQEIGRTCEAAAGRILEARRVAAKDDAAAVVAERDKRTQALLKKYDFGPKIAKAGAQGSAVVDVNLAPDTYRLVALNVGGLKFDALKDAQGAPFSLGTRKVEFTADLKQGPLREALQTFSQEWFTARYSKWENEKATDLIRVVGARLLLGTYWFIEVEDRLVVVRAGT